MKQKDWSVSGSTQTEGLHLTFALSASGEVEICWDSCTGSSGRATAGLCCIITAHSWGQIGNYLQSVYRLQVCRSAAVNKHGNINCFHSESSRNLTNWDRTGAVILQILSTLVSMTTIQPAELSPQRPLMHTTALSAFMNCVHYLQNFTKQSERDCSQTERGPRLRAL